MPERWQDELKKLRREEMPDGVRERAEAGPRRGLPNDGRQRLVAGLVAFAVFIAAGAFAWRAFGGTSTSGTEPTPTPRTAPIVLDLSSNDGNPAATLSSAGGSQNGVREGYDWCGSDGQCVSGIADFSSYPPVSEYLFVPADTPVEVTGDGRIDDIATTLPSGDKAPTHVQIATLSPVTPSDPGRYVWMLDAKWDDGSANYYFGIEIAPPADQVPDVLHVTCSPVSATLESGVVRAQPDGVHIAVNASDDVSGAEIVTGSTPEDFAGVGLDPHGDGSRGIAIAPGSWSVGCYAGEGGGIRLSDIGSGRVATLTVVDPDGLYVEDALGCDVSDTTTIDVTGSVPGSDQNWDTIVADTAAAIPGLLPTDTVRDAGYPEGPGFTDGPHPVVIRDGSVIAILHFQEFVATGGSWSVDLESCTGSGLGEGGNVIESTAAPTVDVAVVRCTDGATEIMTPTVRPQSDGVHIIVDAPGAGGELGVRLQSTTEQVAYLSGSEDPRKGIVRPVGTGTWRVACYSGPAEPNHISDDAPTIEVVDPEGLWTSTTLECSGPRSGVAVTSGQWTAPQDAVRAVSGVSASDVVEPAGYVAGSSGEGAWRVVRGDSTVAWLRVVHRGDVIGWEVTGGEGCTDAGIGVPPTVPTPGT